jgi:hypothetical protein
VLVKWVINFYNPKEVSHFLTKQVKRNFSCNIMKDGVGMFVVCKWNLYSSSFETECKSPPLVPILSHISKFQSSVLSKVKKILNNKNTLIHNCCVWFCPFSQHPSTEQSRAPLIQKFCIYFLFSPTKMKVQCNIWPAWAAL